MIAAKQLLTEIILNITIQEHISNSLIFNTLTAPNADFGKRNNIVTIIIPKKTYVIAFILKLYTNNIIINTCSSKRC